MEDSQGRSARNGNELIHAGYYVAEANGEK
jgi:hypothetical protein